MDTNIGYIPGTEGRQCGGPDTEVELEVPVSAIRVTVWRRKDSERGTTRRFSSMTEATDFVSAIAEVAPDTNITITVETVFTIYAKED